MMLAPSSPRLTAEPPARAWDVSFNGVERLYMLNGPGQRAGLSCVDLTIGAGEIFCLVGPSGCGKTTLLNILAGFDQPTAGSVRVGEEMVKGPSPDRIVVFQEPLIYPWLTVLENIAFGPSVRGLAKTAIREDTEAHVRAIGLSGFEHAYPYQLSGGMRQRVALARALINRPRALLMDEPFSALDAQTRLQMQQLFLDIWRNYRPTTLFITHDVEEALFLADRVGVMLGRPGRIAAILRVDLPRPRTIDTTTSPEFVSLKAQILGMLWGQATAASALC
jgi:NitT/TauT family transport system ATP-binding protein